MQKIIKFYDFANFGKVSLLSNPFFHIISEPIQITCIRSGKIFFMDIACLLHFSIPKLFYIIFVYSQDYFEDF